ncbi:MAG: hypothetical protein ACNFW9_03400 [Candidatus Kerfeldbacteria bacterium]
MSEAGKSPEGRAMWEKATATAQFLKENLNGKNPTELIAIYQQIGIKEDSDESEWLSLAMDQENYIAMSGDKRSRVDDMVESLRSAIEGEGGEM